MRKTILNIVFSAIATTGIAAGYQVQSPDGRLTLTAGTRSGRPYYSMSCGAETVISESFLGMTLAEADLSTDFAVRKITRSSKDETWTQVWGEDETVRNNYNELTLHLRRKSGKRLAMDIVFRVFNDGIGFRYVIPEQKQLSGITVMEENTEFALPQESMAWSISANHADYYEGIYKRSAVAEKDTVCTPLTVECGDSLYLAIHEAALTDYASLTLTPRKSSTLRAALVPWQSGVKVYGGRSLVSPWRTVIVGRTPGELITSRLMLNLNEPCRIEDTSWIEPGRYIGIWWSLHKKNTWEMGAKHGATTANMRRYIDFAARHGFSGVLAEGWNYGWGNGETVTFRRNYPDYDIDSLAAYAREKGVRLIAHTETWGNARLLESEMDSAFAWFNRLGINAVKTGYVNPKLDNRELQHSQYGVRHYRKVIETAARHHLMIDNHEPAMPTGLQRTYPNLMTQEGVRGQEYNAWSADGGDFSAAASVGQVVKSTYLAVTYADLTRVLKNRLGLADDAESADLIFRIVATYSSSTSLQLVSNTIQAQWVKAEEGEEPEPDDGYEPDFDDGLTHKIYVQLNNGWTDLSIYAWNEGEGMLGWPGAAGQGPIEINGKQWYYNTFMTDEDINVIINNNAGVQAPDITGHRDIYLTVGASGDILSTTSGLYK